MISLIHSSNIIKLRAICNEQMKTNRFTCVIKIICIQYKLEISKTDFILTSKWMSDFHTLVLL